jgi:hypothetical protein
MNNNKSRFFSFLLFFLASLRMEALHHDVGGSLLTDHKPPIDISTELLDTFVEKGLSSICMVGSGEATDLSDKLWRWWYEIGDAGATGFFITSEGHFITNRHVVEKLSNPIAFLGLTNQWVKASIVAVHPTEDIAILKIEKPADSNLSYYQISGVREEVGNWVFSLRGRAVWQVSDSQLQLFALPSLGKIMIEGDVLSMNGTQGNSGSPVLNLEGKVIGILTWLASLDGFEVGMCTSLPIHKVKGWIEETLRSDGCFESLE